MKNTYSDVSEYSRERVIEALERDDPEELLQVAISVSMYFPGFEFAQQVCVQPASHEHCNVRGNAVLGFGHIARRFRRLVKPLVEGALKSGNKYVNGQPWAASDDIAHFWGWEIAGLTE
jgi:hypothetical protein